MNIPLRISNTGYVPVGLDRCLNYISLTESKNENYNKLEIEAHSLDRLPSYSRIGLEERSRVLEFTVRRHITQ